MITITRTRIFVAASVLSVSALVSGVAAATVASPANRYDTGQLASVYSGSQPSTIYEHGQPAVQLTNMYNGAQPATSYEGVQLANTWHGAQPGSGSVQLTAVTQGAPANVYEH